MDILKIQVPLLNTIGNMDKFDRYILDNRRISPGHWTLFLYHLDEGFYIKLPIESHHYRLAREWIRQFNTLLRSLDALHLAAASSKGLTVITADESFSKSAEILSIDVIVL